MLDRRSYRGLMRMPAWLLVKKSGKLKASVRAPTRQAARKIFSSYGWKGQVLTEQEWREQCQQQ